MQIYADAFTEVSAQGSISVTTSTVLTGVDFDLTSLIDSLSGGTLPSTRSSSPCVLGGGIMRSPLTSSDTARYSGVTQ